MTVSAKWLLGFGGGLAAIVTSPMTSQNGTKPLLRSNDGYVFSPAVTHSQAASDTEQGMI